MHAVFCPDLQTSESKRLKETIIAASNQKLILWKKTQMK